MGMIPESITECDVSNSQRREALISRDLGTEGGIVGELGEAYLLRPPIWAVLLHRNGSALRPSRKMRK
jgi:hypothetical protein